MYVKKGSQKRDVVSCTDAYCLKLYLSLFKIEESVFQYVDKE